jgi:hypothetical protein
MSQKHEDGGSHFSQVQHDPDFACSLLLRTTYFWTSGVHCLKQDTGRGCNAANQASSITEL